MTTEIKDKEDLAVYRAELMLSGKVKVLSTPTPKQVVRMRPGGENARLEYWTVGETLVLVSVDS